jgi:hypothetical protein
MRIEAEHDVSLQSRSYSQPISNHLKTREMIMSNTKVLSGNTRTPLESDHANMHALISWRSIVAGLLITFFVMSGLVGLGLAFGGINMNEDTSAKSAGIFSGVWFLVSTLVSLFLGSYFAARISKFRTGRIGSAQGLVIASVFLGFFLYQAASAVGSFSSVVGNLIQSSGSVASQGVQHAANNPAVMSAVNIMTEDALGDLSLRSAPRIVAQGLGSRLIQGDVKAAKGYLFRQAGISEAEAETRINQLQAKVSGYIDSVKEATGNALQSLGWSLFLMVALGAIFSVAGGALGSVVNFRRPLIHEDESSYPHGQAV